VQFLLESSPSHKELSLRFPCPPHSLAQRARWAKQNGQQAAETQAPSVSSSTEEDGGCSASKVGESEESEEGSVTANPLGHLSETFRKLEH